MTQISESPIQIAAFYHFQSVPVERVERLAERIEELGVSHGLKGLVIFAQEGINGTVSGRTRPNVDAFLRDVSDLLDFPELPRKWSEAPEFPFRRFKVRVREEIATLGKPEVQPLAPRSATHLPPEEWHRLMQEEDVVVLDTRNWYETRIGKFEGALEPQLNEFHEFSDYLQSAEIPKDKKVLIYCTGGIRCEKAIVEMNNQGFEKVFQLDGGILAYLEKFPNGKFEGECFVFDHRVAVDQELKPSQIYQLCPHCGQPADQPINCLRCDTEALVCVQCILEPNMKTCSKNCAYHYSVAPQKKGKGQGRNYRFLTVGRRQTRQGT